MSGPFIIVGAGQAGAWVAKTLRSEGYGGGLVLIGSEPHLPYERPPLSKSYLSKADGTEGQDILSTDEIERLGIDFRSSTSATKLDIKHKKLHLQDGLRLPYEKLCLCTGGHARALSYDPELAPYIHLLRTRQDADRLRSALHPGQHIAIIGGGWIGLEVAATARQLGAEVTIFEAADRLCGRSVMPEVSSALLDLHRSNNVAIHLGCGPIGLSASHTRSVAIRTEMDMAHFDAVLLSIGLVADDALASGAGLACKNGILVNEQCQSSKPDVFAAGDVAVTPTQIAGHLRLESWQNAQDQGIAAAKAMLGQDIAYTPIPRIWSEQYDTFIRIEGAPHLAAFTYCRSDGDTHLWIGTDKQHKMVSAISFNDMRGQRFAARAIAQDKYLNADELQNTDGPINAAFVSRMETKI